MKYIHFPLHGGSINGCKQMLKRVKQHLNNAKCVLAVQFSKCKKIPWDSWISSSKGRASFLFFLFWRFVLWVGASVTSKPLRGSNSSSSHLCPSLHGMSTNPYRHPPSQTGFRCTWNSEWEALDLRHQSILRCLVKRRDWNWGVPETLFHYAQMSLEPHCKKKQVTYNEKNRGDFSACVPRPASPPMSPRGSQFAICATDF